jgi:protein-ribulosamine 3-kinase
MNFLSGPLRLPVERLVSGYLGRQWRARESRDLNDLASHPCAILSDTIYSVFVKYTQAPDGVEQFVIERAGLQRLARQGGARTPAVIGVLDAERGGALLVMEAVPAAPRAARDWRQMGEALAQLHTATWDQFGLETDSFFGPLKLDNTPLPDWPTFYGERRLRPLLRLAVDARKLPPGLAQAVERLITRLPELCGPAVAPALLHGDAQQNNFISTEAGAVLIDPCVYFGHPEIDLALLDYFQPVPEAVFDGYREVRPIDPGFPARRNLWRVHGYLACVAVAGAEYLGRLQECLDGYVGRRRTD